jgi:hypothetical protein
VSVRAEVNSKNCSGAIEFTVESRSSNLVVAKMPIQPGILTAFGTIHAGALVWFTTSPFTFYLNPSLYFFDECLSFS